MNLVEVLAKLDRLRFRKRLYGVLADTLLPHMRHDIGEPKPIEVDECRTRYVPLECIHEVHDELIDTLDEIEAELARYASFSVSDPEGKKKVLRATSPTSQPTDLRTVVPIAPGRSAGAGRGSEQPKHATGRKRKS